MRRLIYNKLSIIILLPVMALAITGCGDDDKKTPSISRPDWQPVAEDVLNLSPDWRALLADVQDEPKWGVDLKGSDEAPEWKQVASDIYPRSMTLTITLAMQEGYETTQSDKDQLAAFIGDECRGIGTLKNVDDKYVWFVMVKAPDDEMGNVSLRYYHNNMSTLFEINDMLPFVADKIVGTVDKPESVYLGAVSKYPVHMNAVFAIDGDVATYRPSKSDIIAAFIGSDCCGVAKLLAVEESRYIYSIDIYGTKEGESVQLMCYNAVSSVVMSDVKNAIVLKDGATLGTSDVPLKTSFVPANTVEGYLTLPSSLSAYYADDDLVAAFADGVCCGVGKIVDKRIWKMVLTAESGKSVNLYYYSSRLKYLFSTSSALTMSSNLELGTEKTPYEINLNLSGKHPLTMRMIMTLPKNLDNKASIDDEMAAYIGGECRGLAKVSKTYLGYVYTIDVKGTIGADEVIELRYYNPTAGRTYTSREKYPFVEGETIGTESLPEEIAFEQDNAAE